MWFYTGLILPTQNGSVWKDDSLFSNRGGHLMKITVDFTHKLGNIKPMHAVGQPPLEGMGTEYFHYLTEAGIPQSRLHDVGGAYGRNQFVDVPNIFRNFDADETDPASYSFAFTDHLIKGLMEANVEPYFRLGVTIENWPQFERINIYPPKDFEKWARICEHIIRHYNEGWSDGYHFGIKYWEIWNEADDSLDYWGSRMWCGPAEEYFRLYDITTKHLKNCFGNSIKVGGYAACGAVDFEIHDPLLLGLKNPPTSDVENHFAFLHNFFRYIKEHESPIDFFSYHSYWSVANTIAHVRYFDGILKKYGYEHIERHLNEWSLCWAIPGVDCNEKDHLAFSSGSLAMMLALQKEPVDILHYYDARMTSSCNGGLFNSETRKPTNTYFAFQMFNSLYKLGTEVLSDCDCDQVYALAATNDKRNSLVIANTSDKRVEVELAFSGVDLKDAELFRLDTIYRYTPTGETIQNSISLPAYGCAELRFY